ncbi:hypothetical protein IWX46DRAFT_657083, partial [Phyllosticta citricarpa]
HIYTHVRRQQEKLLLLLFLLLENTAFLSHSPFSTSYLHTYLANLGCASQSPPFHHFSHFSHSSRSPPPRSSPSLTRPASHRIIPPTAFLTHIYIYISKQQTYMHTQADRKPAANEIDNQTYRRPTCVSSRLISTAHPAMSPSLRRTARAAVQQTVKPPARQRSVSQSVSPMNE